MIDITVRVINTSSDLAGSDGEPFMQTKATASQHWDKR